MTRSLVGTLLPCYLVLTAITSIALSCESSTKEDNKVKCSHSDSEQNQKQGPTKKTGEHQKIENNYPSGLYEYNRPTPLLHKQACYYQNKISYLPRRSWSWYQSNKPSFYPRYYTKRPSYKTYSFYQPQSMPLYDRPSISLYGSPYQLDSYKDHSSQLYNSNYKMYSDDEHYPYQPFASEDIDSTVYDGSDDDYDLNTFFSNDYNQRRANNYLPAEDYYDHAIPVEHYKGRKYYLNPKEMKHPPPSFKDKKEVSSSDPRLFGVASSPN